MKKLILSMAVLLLAGCQSEQEKIHEAQIETCKKSIKAGEEPSEFCLNLLPEYRQVAAARPQYAPQEQPLQQYSPAQYAEQPVVQAQPGATQQPIIVNQPAPAARDNGMTDMLVGGLIGHAIGSSGNNTVQAAPTNNHYYDRQPAPRYIDRKTTIIRQVAPAQAPAPVAAPKKNYMDTSKLKAYGARPAAPVSRPSSMNMGRLSSYGKRK